jgi:hypothetical protein
MSLYPTIAAGTRITAALLQSMLPQTVYKPANTDRTATTTLADDPDLTVQLAANAVYQVEMRIYYATTTGTGAPLFKTAWDAPSGATGNRSCTGPGSAATDGGADNMAMHSGVHNFATTVTYGGRNSATSQCVAIETGTITTSAAGALAFQWAQATSSATAVRVGAASSMTVRRIG